MLKLSVYCANFLCALKELTSRAVRQLLKMRLTHSSLLMVHFRFLTPIGVMNLLLKLREQSSRVSPRMLSTKQELTKLK
jgi:hypothetical protein